MKKILLCATALFTLAAVIMAANTSPPRKKSSPLSSYDADVSATLGRVVKASDVAGIGEIIEASPTNFSIQVDHPFYGCTNNQIFTLHRSWSPFRPDNPSVPPETGRIVFAVYTNVYVAGYVYDWNDDFSEHDIKGTLPEFRYRSSRGWFYPESEEGIYFTNLIHAIRIERNWTNYYELCRSGFASESGLISRSAEEDLKNLISRTSSPSAYDELLYMRQDPLFPGKIELKWLLDSEISKREKNPWYFWREMDLDMWERAEMTLGFLANETEAAGIGQVIGQEITHSWARHWFTIQVDIPFLRCKSDQVLKLDWKWGSAQGYARPRPDTGDRIVFVTRSKTGAGPRTKIWDFNQSVREATQQDLYLPSGPSWFYPDDEDGLPFAYFTNVLHTLRVERNWTNYYGMVRDGMGSPSPSVRQDAYWDLRRLVIYGTLDQLFYMRDDPLFPALHARVLAREIGDREANPGAPVRFDVNIQK